MNNIWKTLLIIGLCCPSCIFSNSVAPIVVATWNVTKAAQKAWSLIYSGASALDAVEAGCEVCEALQCGTTVGYGGSPDENGETTLDALIMDGDSMNVGSVMGLRRVKNAIGVARVVLDHTEHSILSGDLATEFAIQMGFRQESLQTNFSKTVWENWKANNCQPNFWQNVHPDPEKSCGPYKSNKYAKSKPKHKKIDEYNHDTIGMIAIDQKGSIAAATSTNGANHKIPGRVGDSPIPGSGGYADSEIGAAAATGDGDVMLRFLPSFLAVEEMRRSRSPSEAAEIAIRRIVSKYPKFSGGVIAINKDGQYGAACNNLEFFPFVVADLNSIDSVRTEIVQCVTKPKDNYIEQI